MRRVFITDQEVTSAVIVEALALGASEIVQAPDGVLPPAVSGLSLGYHEITETGDATP